MRHVVFVDDDAAVLSGLRRMLHSMRGRWRMTFVTSGPEALELLAAEPAAVIVSDMRMPGMDGAELLTEVRRRWPETVRIILSGYADQGAALRAVPVAHRFLDKPCDPGILSAALLGACDLQDRLSRPELRSLIGGLGGLPSAPHSFAAITEALGRPDTDTATVVPIIEQDPGCSVKLLQLVNSAFFGLARTITSIQEAVSYLGLIQIRNVVLATGVSELFRCESADIATSIEDINRHSLRVGALASEQVPPGRAHEAFVAGMLHDIGHLTLAKVTPEQFLATRQAHTHSQEAALDAERALLGATHAEVGAYLLRLWGLPFPFVDVAARHHDADARQDSDPVIAAVAAAEVSSTMSAPAERKG